jgi:hypothetical protein
MGKVWIPASAGMSGWRGFVFSRSFHHTLYGASGNGSGSPSGGPIRNTLSDMATST